MFYLRLINQTKFRMKLISGFNAVIESEMNWITEFEVWINAAIKPSQLYNQTDSLLPLIKSCRQIKLHSNSLTSVNLIQFVWITANLINWAAVESELMSECECGNAGYGLIHWIAGLVGCCWSWWMKSN